MAAVLRSVAAASINKGPPSSFFGPDQKNPVLQSLENEIQSYQSLMKKRATPGYRRSNDEAPSRVYSTLFELWNKYESKLPTLYYQKKLLEMGDFLVAVKEFNLALWQCYGRYLRHLSDIEMERIADVTEFKKTFFPGGFGTDDAGFTFRALMGKTICTYQSVRMTDNRLQNSESVEKCIKLLNFLRLMTQVILPKESLCWLVFNGTVHIYSISRHLMMLGHAVRVLEYLLWACMCMESSIPLLSVRYLTWRTTLYTAVCQAYYDCKAGPNAESFARRALTKINELSELENKSNASENVETHKAFRIATLKMAIMVYRRTVFETRRKPKGFLRPRNRANLKDAAQLMWPRTASEKMLVEMFEHVEGSAAQMLCLLESLSDSGRRTLLSSPPAPENEVEILDVYAELFMAAQEIIAGGGGAQGNAPPQQPSESKAQRLIGVIKNESLIELASKGEDGVPINAVVRMVKLAYCYEQWETFDNMINIVITALKEINDPKNGPDEKALEILKVYDKVTPRNRQRKLFVPDEELESPEDVLPLPPNLNKDGSSSQDDVIRLAEILLSVVTGPYSQEEMDMDMMVDACLALWSKCKQIFQKFQTGSSDNPKYLEKMENPSKWVYVLDIVHQVMGWCGLSAVDPALTAEVALRLGLAFEASASLEASPRRKTGKGSGKTDGSTVKSKAGTEEDHSVVSGTVRDHLRDNADSAAGESISTLHYAQSYLGRGAKQQLLQARDILELGLRNVSYARQMVAVSDSKSIADVVWAKEVNHDLFKPLMENEMKTDTPMEEDDEHAADETQVQGDAAAIWSMVQDLHLELMFIYHRVCLKLTAFKPETKSKIAKPFKRRTCSLMEYESTSDIADAYIETYEELIGNCNKNGLSKALLCMQQALAASSGGKPSTKQKALLQEAKELIRKAQTEEKKLYTENNGPEREALLKRVPPAPIILSRTDTTAVFRPGAFVPASNVKVAWYRVFARPATGSNVKVRLNDYFLQGTGEEVPASGTVMRVTGLTPGERYIYAVAAYSADGKLIGDSIGDSTRPILATHPLPVLLSWAFLCQVGYQIGDHGAAKESSQFLWSHFVAQPPPDLNETYFTGEANDFRLTLHRLNPRVVKLASPVLLRMYLNSIFIHVDINIREGALFCDKLCDNGPLLKGQLGRLSQCEYMLVALELAGWLNESNLALQAVVQCYGLLAPLIHFKIPSTPVLQVLERCHAVLQDIPTHLRIRKQANISDSLHHMIACLTHSLAKVLRTWKQRALANNINDSGRKMLTAETEKEKEMRLEQLKAAESGKEKGPRGTDVGKGSIIQTDLATERGSLLDGGRDTALEQQTETGSMTLAALKKKKVGKKTSVTSGRDDFEIPGNEELKALEAHMLKLSKQAQGEHELSGNEDPSILHAYIAYLPSKTAYKEVVKFKRRARYLEFFVQCAQKSLSEGLAESALEWCEDTLQWLNKRNDGILGFKIPQQKLSGEKYAATVAEYTREAGGNKTNRSQKKVKRPKYKAVGVTSIMNDVQKQAQEEAELKALDILTAYFLEAIQTNHRRKRFRRINQGELPWRSQLNVVQGLGHFGVFLQQLETREKVFGNKANHMYRTSFLDQEWFTLETAGALVVGWEGGPTRQFTRHEPRTMPQSQQSRVSGIEIAAQAATGKPAASLFAIPIEEEDNMSTYRSDLPTKRGKNDPKKGKGEEPAQTTLVTGAEAQDLLQKTFKHLQRAIILAYRGQHWTLLQNSCRSLWNSVHTALLRTYSADGDSLLSVDELRGLAWKPCYVAVDCLLDMVLHLQTDYFDKKPDDSIVSWTGQAESEKGGATLKFEGVLDDISATDLRWLRRIVLRVIEMLYYEQKWEHVVDVGLRFSAISGDRYAEQVNPLVVQAQRKLIQRIENSDGVPPPQPHFKLAEKELGGPVNGKTYTNLQLKMKGDEEADQENFKPFLKPAATGLCRVPLDVSVGLDELRQALSRTNYSARALQHCRRLLVLYLAGQTNAQADKQNTMSSRVDFKPNTAGPQPTMPVDLSKEEFLSMEDVQLSPLSKSQVTVVMTSYEKAIEMLLANNQRSLAAEAMKELANIHYNTGNMKGAYQWWSEALDMLLNGKNVMKNWQTLYGDQEDLSKTLLEKSGMWGCIMGAVLCANIAQYVLTSNLKLRSECCFLAGYFFKALFRSSLPHPVADRDYALYEVGEGCEVSYLIPGIDLLSERFRCDGRTLVSSLQYVTDELTRGRHYLFVLPLLSLRQYFTSFMCRDLQRCVDTRIRKVKVLTDLGFFSEALVNLMRLLNGERLPQTADSTFRQLESRGQSSQFDASKPVMDPNNMRVLEGILDKRLSSNLSLLYGPHLTCQLSIAQAHLFIAVANTIQELPRFEEGSVPGTTWFLQPHSISMMSKNGQGARDVFSAGPGSKPGLSKRAVVGETPGGEAEEMGVRSGKRFSSAKVSVTSAVVKGTLLATADQILSTLSDIIAENAITDSGLEGMSAAELELVIMSKLELAAISLQRQHSAMAASITLTAMRMIQASNIFSKRKTPSPPLRRASSFRERRMPDLQVPLVETESSLFQLQDFQSRLRLDARLWLQCRQTLVNSLMGEIKGMGQVKGEKDVKAELADVRMYCAEGVAEAEACGDLEMKAEFLMQGMLLDMMEGSSLEASTGLLQEVIRLLQSVTLLSDPGKLLLTWSEVYLIDLQANMDSTKTPGGEYLDHYCKAHQDILTQMQSLGEQVEHYRPPGAAPYLSTLVSPIQILYLPHLLLLVQTKLRIAHAMAGNIANAAASKDISNEMLAKMWAEPLGVLKTSLELSQVMAMYIPSLEADILLLMGKTQRQLVQLGYYEMDKAAGTLMKAIEVTFHFDHDLGLIKQAYLELAALYLGKVQQCMVPAVSPSKDTTTSVTTTQDQQSTAADETSTSKPDSAKSPTRRKPKSKTKDRLDVTKPNKEDEVTKKAWLAVRCAVAVGQSQQARLLLPGSPEVTSKPVGTNAKDHLPEFLLIDLLAGYVLGDKKRVYKDVIEEEMAPLTESLEPPVAETYDDQLIKMRNAATDLSWLHVLGYQATIQRLSNTATLSSMKRDSNKDASNVTAAVGVHFDLGQIDHSQLQQTLNNSRIRLPLSGFSLSLRQACMHQYLVDHLPAYTASCSAIYPPKQLYSSSQVLQYDDIPSELQLKFRTYGENRIVPLDVQPDASAIKTTFAPRTENKTLINPTDAEVCFQWYLPSLQQKFTVLPGENPDRKILLFYATNGKKCTNLKTSSIWVSLKQLLDLHDRLAVLSQRAEISLTDKAIKKEREVTPTPTPTRGKKQMRIKPMSPRVKRDEQLEELLMQCMADVQKLLGVVLIDSFTPTPSVAEETVGAPPSSNSLQPPSFEEPTFTPIPPILFEVTKRNVRSLEKLFDPSCGSMLRESKMINWFMKLFQ